MPTGALGSASSSLSVQRPQDGQSSLSGSRGRGPWQLGQA